MGRVTRKYEIAKRRRRQNKIKALRMKIARAKDATKIQKWVEKIKRIHPHYPLQSLNK
jgi:hypothetical protein